MARGYIFEASTNPENLGMMTEEDFYECFDALSADYIQTRRGEDALERVQDLCDSFAKYGAEIIPHNMPYVNVLADDGAEDDEHVPYFEVYFPAGFRDAYFAQRFELVKQAVANMTLHEFSTDADLKVYNLRMFISDTYDDIIYLDGYRYILDDFVRDYEDFRFYVSAKTIVFMH